MTATERLAEIKAQLAEVEVAWELSLSEIDEVSDTLRSLVTALEAVLEAHRRGHPVLSKDDMCMHCRDEFGALVAWPCPTVQAITEALGVDQ